MDKKKIIKAIGILFILIGMFGMLMIAIDIVKMRTDALNGTITYYSLTPLQVANYLPISASPYIFLFAVTIIFGWGLIKRNHFARISAIVISCSVVLVSIIFIINTLQYTKNDKSLIFFATLLVFYGFLGLCLMLPSVGAQFKD